MLIICGTPQWISEQLLYVFINIVIYTYMGSAYDVPNKTVHLCDHHQKNFKSHDNEENSVKYIASNGGEITYHNNDENEIEKLRSMDNHFLLDDIHTCYENVTVLYLAGYDDEIFELRNDLLKKGEGNELVIIFFLYRDHKILNIGKIHTNIIFFDESILKYTHYYYLDSETVKNTCCFNKLRFENLGDNVPDETINENQSKYFRVYPQKENDGYEFIIPKEKDIVMKDIIVDLNKNKDDKLNKPAGSTSVFTSSLLDQPNDNEIYYVDEDFLNPCTHGKYLKRKDKKDYMKKNQTLKSHMEISPPVELESKTEDVLDKQSKSILSNTKRVLVPCNDDNLEQTNENLLTFTPVTSTLINRKPKDTEKTRVSKIFKDKSIKNFQNHKDTTYYRLPETLDSNTKTITDQVSLYKNPFSDVNVKGFNIVAPILFQGNRIDKNINDNNRVRPNDSHYYSHEKPSDDILLNTEYDINKPNYKAISHIHTSNQYIPKKMLPTKVVSKNIDTQIKNIPFDRFKPLSSFSDGSHKNQDKILGSNVPYDNNYILNPSYVTYKQNLKPLENKKYNTINPVVDFSIPVITSSSNIKINDKNKKIASLPEAYSLYYRNSATQEKKYEPNKTLIPTLSILNIPCQKLTNDKCRVLNADSTNIINIPRDLDVSLINTNEKLSASPRVHDYHFYSSKYNINDKIKPEEIKAYPYYSKYNELLPASYVPKLHATNFIHNTPFYLPKEHSNLSKSVNQRLHSFKTFASSTNTPAQSKYDFISCQPDLYQPIRTKVYQPLEDILESSNMPMNGNPNIIHYVESDFLLNKEKPITSGILSETGRLIPYLIKKDLNKPETPALPLQPSIELVSRKPQNIVLTSSEQKGAQATYESPLNVVICKNKYAIPNPNINIVKNLNFIKKAGIPKLSTLNHPYENVSWFKKYQQNIPKLLPYTKLSYFQKIKPPTKIPFENSYTPSAPIYSSEIPKSPHNLISLTLAPVSPETIHMSQKPDNIIEFPSRNDLSISSKKFQSTQFVSTPKSNFTSNQLDIDLRNPIKKQKPSRFRPNIYQYPSKYRLSYLMYEPDVMSNTIFKLSQHVLKPNVPTLNSESASLSSLTKLSHRFWPQNILTSPITSQIAAMSERKMLYRPKENFKEYILKSYLSSKPQVVTSTPLYRLSLHEAIPNKPIIEEISPIPSYKKMVKFNKSDVSSNIIFTLPQERLKSSIPIFNQESPTTKDTVCIKNLKLHTFPYVPLQYRNWPQNIITLPITSPYMVPVRNQARKNLAQYPLKPYLSANPQPVPASAFPIISLPTPEIKSLSRSPVPGIRNIPQSDITSPMTSQHVPMAEINKYLHLSKQNVNQYPPRSYSIPEADTTKVFSFKSPIAPLPRVSSSPNLPLYETIPKKQTNQGISPSYIKLCKLNDHDISTNTIFTSSFYMPNFNQESPTVTDTLSYNNLKVQTNPCIEKPSQYLNWPQNIIPSLITSPYVVTPERNQNLHLPKKNLNQFPLEPYLSPKLKLAKPFTELTHIPAVKSFLLPNKPAVKIILLNNSHKQPYKLTKPDTLSRTKFPLPKQYYKQNLLHINQEPVLYKPIFNLFYPKYMPKEVYPLRKQFSLSYDKFKVLPTNEYKSIPKSKLNTVPSISPLTITKIWSPNGKAYAPLFNTISPSKQFSLRPEQRFPIIFFKPIDKNVSSPTMKSLLLTQPTFKNSLHLHPHRISLLSLPSSIQYPYQHTSLDSNSLNISTKVDSISPIAISRNNKLQSPYLLPKKVSQNKITPKLSSSSNSLLENSLQFQTPTIQDTDSKAKLDNLPLSNIDNTNNKKHYPHFETLPFSNMKSFLRNFKVPNQVIYIPFPSNMNLKSSNSFITSNSLRLPLITSSEPSKSDLPRILSSTLAYPLQKSVLPFTPLAQSLSEITPSQFRPANGQSLNLPTKRKLLKNPLTLPFKYESISHHPHYEPVQTLDIESSAAHFNSPNHSMIQNKYKNILKSSYKNQNDVTYLTENQDQVSFNKDVINTQSTFSKVLNAHPHTNYLPSLKTLELYPTFKPYTTTHMIYPSLSIAKTTNNFSPLQPNSNIIPFKSYLSYIQPFIKTPSYYQTEHQGTSAPIITPSYQSISVKNSPTRQFEPTNILTIPSKWSLFTTLQAASLFKSDLTSLSLPLLKSSSILSSYLHHPVYKPLPTLDSEILISPPNLIKKSTWPLNKPNFTPKTFGKYQNYQPFNSQDRVILNINNINTQPSMTPITKVTSNSFNKLKLYPSLKPLNIQAFKAPFSISNVDTTNKHILLQPQPDSSYLKPSERTPIPDYYQTTSPNQLAWTKTIATGNSKDMGTLYHIQTSKSSTNQQLKKSLTLDMNTLKPNLAYSSPTISSPAEESYHSAENADFLTDKAFAFEKSSSYPLPLNFKLRSNMYPIYKGSKIKYFTSNTEIPSKTVNNLDTGKYNHINYLQVKPITKNQLYSNILYNNNNYKKNYPIIYSVNHRTHILSPLGTLNEMNLYQQEFLRDRERNLNIPVAKILQKSYKPDLGLREIVINNEINENIPFIRTQGMKQFRKEIPLPNISILKYDPREISNDVEITTDNPDIFIKAWTSRIEVIKPRIVYDTFQVQAYNFEPIVKELGKYDPNVVEGVVKSYVEKNYGEPIVLKGTYSFYKPYIISNVNNKYLKHGKIYLVWPTLCDCGCKRLGCQCHRKFYK